MDALDTLERARTTLRSFETGTPLEMEVGHTYPTNLEDARKDFDKATTNAINAAAEFDGAWGFLLKSTRGDDHVGELPALAPLFRQVQGMGVSNAVAAGSHLPNGVSPDVRASVVDAISVAENIHRLTAPVHAEADQVMTAERNRLLDSVS